MKKKLISAILTAVMAVQLFTAVGSVAAAESGDYTPPLSITDPIPEDDLCITGAFNSDRVLRSNWAPNSQTITFVEDANGGYLSMSDIINAWDGFDYYPSTIVGPGTYKFTGYFRTTNPGEISMLQVLFGSIDSTIEAVRTFIYVGNDWVKAEFYVTLYKDLYFIRVRGGPYDECVQEYCVDNFSLVAVDPEDIPEDSSLRCGDNLGLTDEEYVKKAFESMPISKTISVYDPEKEKQYDVGGIMINHDITDFIAKISINGWNEKDIVDYARQFEGTHVTDYIINVFSEGTFNYPTKYGTDYLELYTATERLGVEVDYTETSYIEAANYLYNTLSTDYIGLWCEYFPTIGINPWLSFRMNDVHEMYDSVVSGVPSGLISDFYYKNPGLRRNPHHFGDDYKYANSYDFALNYKYAETREYVLGAINDALSTYNAYGIELDFQRNMYLFGIGEEYEGLDTMNKFMRDVDDLVAIYEEKYGHEIKISARVASDIQSCYDFGLDVLTWAAEGIIDLITPTGHYSTTDMDIPTKIWSSAMAPHGVEVAPGIESHIRASQSKAANTGGHTFSTMAAFSANAFSQGADKVYLYNFFRGSTKFDESKKYTLTSDFYSLGSDAGFWNMITTIGSYEKLMTVNRRSILTYSDTYQIWRDSNAQLPLAVDTKNYATLRIPMGDVSEGAVLTLKFSTSLATLSDTPPTVYVNSKLCTFTGMETCVGGYVSDKLMCYTIPVEAHNGGYMVAEIRSDVDFTIEYAEVFLEMPVE